MLRCECGFEARAADEEGLVAQVRRHARTTHGMTLSRHDALILAFRAELDRHADRGPSSPETRTDEEER